MAMSRTSRVDLTVVVTRRRAEILGLLAEGYRQPEIASRLGISPNTVRSTVAALKDCTGCKSVRELGRWWRLTRTAWLLELAEIAGV
jgi:DNA-binding CsgD family transcriptional regulator